MKTSILSSMSLVGGVLATAPWTGPSILKPDTRFAMFPVSGYCENPKDIHRPFKFDRNLLHNLVKKNPTGTKDPSFHWTYGFVHGVYFTSDRDYDGPALSFWYYNAESSEASKWGHTDVVLFNSVELGNGVCFDNTLLH